MVNVLFLLGHLLFLLFLIFGALSFFTGAPYLPTPARVVSEMMQVGGVGKNDVVIDLGSGDGRLIIAAAKLGAHGEGWEINPVLVLISLVSSLFHGVWGRIRIRWGDYRRADFRSATVIVMYSISGKHIATIAGKCRRELRSGSRIISYQFALPDFPCIKKTKTGIYLYRVPEYDGI